MRGVILPGRNEPGRTHPGGAGVSHRERGREAVPAEEYENGQSRAVGAKRERVRGSRGMSGRRAAKPDDGLSTARSGCATCKADNARMHEVGATKFRALNIIPLA